MWGCFFNALVHLDHKSRKDTLLWEAGGWGVILVLFSLVPLYICLLLLCFGLVVVGQLILLIA